MGVARRSMKLNGILLLGNDMIIPRDPLDFGNHCFNENQVKKKAVQIDFRMVAKPSEFLVRRHPKLYIWARTPS